MAKTWSNMTKREMEILVLDMFKIRWLVLTTYDKVVQRSKRGYNIAKMGTECEQNACTTLHYVSLTLWYATIRCDTLFCVAATRYNATQRGTTWRQRRYCVTAARNLP